jgi:hypothetical protein
MNIQQKADTFEPVDNTWLSVRVFQCMKKGFVLGGKYVVDELLSLYPSCDVSDMDIDDAYSLLVKITKKINELKV